jgi:hypothetical protein
VAAKGGRVGQARFQFRIDCVQNARQIVIGVTIPKPQHSKSGLDQGPIASSIRNSVTFAVMLSAINLNNQAVLKANEIDNVTFARSLTTKMKSPFPP